MKVVREDTDTCQASRLHSHELACFFSGLLHNEKCLEWLTWVRPFCASPNHLGTWISSPLPLKIQLRLLSLIIIPYLHKNFRSVSNEVGCFLKRQLSVSPNHCTCLPVLCWWDRRTSCTSVSCCPFAAVGYPCWMVWAAHKKLLVCFPVCGVVLWPKLLALVPWLW